MGKPTGFLEYGRRENGDIPVCARIQTFEEFHTDLREGPRREQAARCMNCGVPFCQSAMQLSGMVTGCPLHNLIPEWNDQIYRGHEAHAYARLAKTNNFPEFTGRVCPALCEKACTNGAYGAPVTIHDNEKYLIEAAFEQGLVQPRLPAVRSGKRVAVVGSGPAGLAAADELNHRGHSVTVFERDDRVGGLLMYGIPNMKLDKDVVARRQTLMEREGVTFRTGMNVGADAAAADSERSGEAGVAREQAARHSISAEELLQHYDAVVLACGAKQPRALPAADPAKVKGVYYAVDFLKATTHSLLAGEGRRAADLAARGGYIDAKGKHVVVVGGGDTGNDCIGTVIRHGCQSVTALEIMPEPPAERLPANPWPEWPKVKKTDYGHEEAIALFGHDPRVYETTVKAVLTNKKGEIKKIRTVQVCFEKGKLTEAAGTEKELPCDLLLIAAGFTGCEPYTAAAFGVALGARGTVSTAAPDRYATARLGVFAAGDMHRGQSLVVWAIQEGRACAREVDAYLMGYTTLA